MILKLCISKTGHDKGKVYLIIEETDTHCFLVNGQERTISSPKKKNIKHIQVIKDLPQSVKEILTGDSLGDLQIKRAIKLYRSGAGSES